MGGQAMATILANPMSTQQEVQAPELSDDPLALLPRRRPQLFYKDNVVYKAGDPAESLFLVVDGSILISRTTQDGREAVLDVESRETFFGFASILGGQIRAETATALETSSVMEWSSEELQELIGRSPQLGVALMRVVAKKLSEADTRLASFATDQVPRRLVKALLRLGERFGQTSTSHPIVKLIPLTHDLLAKYVGTSREVVTHHMSVLRKKALVSYSRAYLEFEPEKLRAELENLK
jgi:CRP/FNR family transcriptional regulator